MARTPAWMDMARAFNRLSAVVLALGGCASLFIAVSAQTIPSRNIGGILSEMLEYPIVLFGLLLMLLCPPLPFAAMLLTVRRIATTDENAPGARARVHLAVMSLLGFLAALALLASSLFFYVDTFYLAPPDPFSGLILVVIPVWQLLAVGGLSGMLVLWRTLL